MNLGRQTSIQKPLTKRLQVFEAAFLDSALTFEMHEIGALLGLDWTMLTNLHETLDNPIKGVHIIIE
jgi:hypothetical protein